MNIEKDIFESAKLQIDKLEKYGFKKDNDIYNYSRNIMDNKFRVDITIDTSNNIFGKIYELETNEEYTNFRIENITGEFVSKVKEEYIEVLKDILDHCYKKEYFLFEQTNRMSDYIIKKYNTKPEFLWKSTPKFGVFRNKKTGKWIGLVQNFDKSLIVPTETGHIELIDLKLDEEVPNYIDNKTIFGYPQKTRRNWLRVILDDSLDDNKVIELIDKSYEISNK